MRSAAGRQKIWRAFNEAPLESRMGGNSWAVGRSGGLGIAPPTHYRNLNPLERGGNLDRSSLSEGLTAGTANRPH